MSLSPHMTRWIYSSCASYFNTNRGVYNFRLEAENNPTDELTNWIEFRMWGPHVNEVSKDTYILTLTINLLLMYHLKDNGLYQLHTMAGHLMPKFGPITIYKNDDALNPDAVVNDGTAVGCLQLKPPVQFAHMGATEHFNRATIQGRYIMHLDG